ncbi:MAG: radical SAM protein [Caldisericum exile]|uniref:Radical SAM protein n=4 Tax=Caldisericum TaxID=693074 RepID=A0A2J6X779_9BACT|nr:MAG: radical SAM protein [Caldisericum exile]
MSIGEEIKRRALSRTIEWFIGYVYKNPEENLKRGFETLYRLSNTLHFDQLFKDQIKNVLDVISSDTPTKQYVVNLFKDTRKDVLQKIAVNFIVNAGWYGVPKQRNITVKEGFKVPWFMLVDPTERCNYNCIGCWAGSYDRAHELSFERFDRLMNEAKELGIYFIVVSGGEPTIYPHLIDIFKKHNDMAFMFYTNGSLITEKYAERLAEVGNAVPCISVEGFKEKTDWRRGEGAWDRVIKAMDNLKKVKVPFGYSVTETSKNIEEVLSDEFVDFMIDKGAKIAWYFQYIPTGKDPDITLMLTPEQRLYSYKRIHEIRATKPLFAADFWNDGPYTGGCLAGGRRYLHITADGGIEPCAFIHLAQGNINEISLKEALQLPFFKEIQKLQPYSDNLLRPCMLVDNPQVFRKIGSLPGVRSTDGTLENMYKDVGKHLDELSKKWEEISRPVFEHDHPEVAKRIREYKQRKEKVLKENEEKIEAFYRSGETY